MGGSMSLIVPGVYVGGLSAAKSKLQLSNNNITHLCTVLDQDFEPRDKQHMIFRAGDSPDECLSRYFEDACSFIHEARISGGCVLVHCACGVSRSVTITLAYLLVVTDFPFPELFKAIQGARHCACPNHGFVQQLKEFEGSRAAQVREKLFERFGEWPSDKREADSKALKEALEIQNYYILNGVYPGEQSLENAPTESSKSSCGQGKAIFDSPTVPIRSLDPGYYTVYSKGKPRNLDEFLLARSHASPPTTESAVHITEKDPE